MGERTKMNEQKEQVEKIREAFEKNSDALLIFVNLVNSDTIFARL